MSVIAGSILLHCPSMVRKYRLSTLGCKVNQYESQLLRQTLERAGLHPATPDETPDLVVINTCAVTATAMNDNRRTIRRAANHGATPVIVVGCGVSANADQFRALPGVVAVLGHEVNIVTELKAFVEDGLRAQTNAAVQEPFSTERIPAAARSFAAFNASVRSDAGRPSHGAPASQAHLHSSPIIPLQIGAVKNLNETTGNLLLDRIDVFAGHQRAFLKVQDGCDAHCTYCIIPKLRPTLRSKPADTVVEEAKALVRSGHKEIILTGIFLGAYGRPTAIRRQLPDDRLPLADLVEAVSCVDGLERLRLSSLEPGDVDDALLEVLASRKSCVPHLHLPLQSGSESILCKMNRQYTRDDYVKMVDRVRAALDYPAITTDIIVGFPGETESDFESSLEIARYAEFCKIHAFPFSPREGTAAARWKEKVVPSHIARERMRRLALIETECSLNFRRRLVGCVERVIVEGEVSQRWQDRTVQSRAAGLSPRDPIRERLTHLMEQTRKASPIDSSSSVLQRPRSHAPQVLRGRTDRYFEVHFETGDGVRPGDLVGVRIIGATPGRTHAELLAHRASERP